MEWNRNTGTLQVLSDKYANRFVETLLHRCTAYKYFVGTATYSDKVAFWYEDYATPEDAVNAAKKYLLRGELEREVELIPFDYAPFTVISPEPEIEKRGW